MGEHVTKSEPAERSGLPSRRGCLLLIFLALLVIGIPIGVRVGPPLVARLAEASNPQLAAVEQTCHDAIALSLELASAPDGYSADVTVPQEVRDQQVTKAEQLLPTLFTGELLQREMTTFRAELHQGRFVSSTKLLHMRYGHVSIEGAHAMAKGVATLGQSSDTAHPWEESFTITLVKHDAKWLITEMDFVAH